MILFYNRNTFWKNKKGWEDEKSSFPVFAHQIQEEVLIFDTPKSADLRNFHVQLKNKLYTCLH